MNNQVTSILLSGVGGQGILLASELICHVLLEKKYDVKKNEIHGMSQRGGSVTSHIRYGKQVFSPVIPAGEADFLLGFEKLEGYRYIHMLKKDGKLLLNDFELIPGNMLLKKEPLYPKDLNQTIEKKVERVLWVKAQELASELGNIRVMNIILLGVLAGKMDIPVNLWQEVIEKHIKPQFIDINKAAFQKGFTL